MADTRVTLNLSYAAYMPITVCPSPSFNLRLGAETDNPAFSGRSFVPCITSLTPFTAPAGSGDQTLHAYGSGFTGTSVIWINNVAKTTTFVNSGELTATISPSGLVAGNYPIKVKGAQDSGTIYFEIS